MSRMERVAIVLAPVLLRLALFRVPRGEEIALFRRGVRTRYVALPPLFRGLLLLGEGRETMRQATALAAYHGAWRGAGDPFAARILPDGVAPVPDLAGDIRVAWTGPDLGFLHFEKCGGVGLVHWLSGRFHPDQIDPDPWRAAPPSNFYRAPNGLGRECARYPLLWGHFGLDALRRIDSAGDAGRFVFTLLREPKARLVSLYQYWRSVNPEMIDDLAHDPIVGAAHRHDLLGFLRDPEPLLRDYLDNVYVRRLTGHYLTGAARDLLAEDPVGALAAAAAALDGLGFVGITECLDESAARLASRIGIAPPVASVRGNVAAENHEDPSGWFRRIGRMEITPEADAALDELTVLDRELYARARARFDAGACDAKQVVAG